MSIKLTSHLAFIAQPHRSLQPKLTTSPLTISPVSCPTSANSPPLDLKQVDPDGTFSGYASLFNTEDMGRDIVLPGAFRDSLRERGPAGIKLLYQHNPAEPIGIWESLKEDSRGLHVRGRLMLAVARAREVLALMRAGALDGLSIGFRAVTGKRDAKTGIRHLAKIDLWEISIVTFPLLAEARVAHVKSAADRRLLAAIADATRRFGRRRVQ